MRILFTHALLLAHADASPVSDACVAVENGRIVYLGHQAPEHFLPQRKIDCGGDLLMPGFVNAHTHSPLSLLRSYGEGMDLRHWLENAVWPYEDRHTDESCYWGAVLNAAECMRAGVTCTCDMYTHGGAVAQAMADVGMRSLVTPTVTDVLTEQDPELLSKISHLADKWANHPLVRIGISPHAVYTCGDTLLEAAASLAEKHRLPIHIHVSETLREQQQCMDLHGHTPLVHLDQRGLLGPQTLMAHCVYFTPEDIALTAARGASVVHCPRSNLKLGSGIAPVPDFLAAGIPVGLGTDSSASNNNQDILEEMRFASLLQKGIRRDPTCMSPAESLHMAVSGVSRAMGFPVGCLAAGSPADLILVRRTDAHWQPGLDLRTDLVYAAHAADVRLTMINGQVVYEDGQYPAIDMERLYRMLPAYHPARF